MSRPSETEFLNTVLRGEQAAVRFCLTLFSISQTLDDLIDKDREATEFEIFSAFWNSLIELPANPFYRQYEPYLRPLMASAMQDWRDSVALERSGSEHCKTIAFVLRDQLTSVVVQCAYLVGGQNWAATVGPDIRNYFHDETLGDYINGLQEVAA